MLFENLATLPEQPHQEVVDAPWNNHSVAGELVVLNEAVIKLILG